MRKFLLLFLLVFSFSFGYSFSTINIPEISSKVQIIKRERSRSNPKLFSKNEIPDNSSYEKYETRSNAISNYLVILATFAVIFLGIIALRNKK